MTERDTAKPHRDSAFHPVARWIEMAAAHPRAVLAGVGLLLALSVLAAFSLGIDTDTRRMLSPDLPFQERAQALNEAFPDTKNTVVVAVRGPADAADLAVSRLVEALDGAPGVAEVFAPSVDPYFLRNGLLYLDTATLERQLTRLSKSANLMAALRAEPTLAGFLSALDEARRLAERSGETAALDPLYAEAVTTIGALVRGQEHAFAWTGALAGEAGSPVLRPITIQPALDFTALNPARQTMRTVDAAIAALDPAISAPVEIGVTGDPVLRAEELRSVADRIGLSLGLSLALVALVLWLALGTLARAGLAFAALVITLVLTTGAAALTVGTLNLVSVAFVVLMTGLGIDFAIHLMAHLDEDARRLPPKEALGATGRTLGPALALTAASTAAAFLAFAATDFIGMAQLGLIGALGVLIAFGVAITLIPAATALAPGLAEGRGAVLPMLPKAHARWLPGVAAALGLVAAVLATGARFDADPMGLRNPDARSVQVYGWLLADAQTAPLTLAVLTDDADEAETLARRLEALAEVRRATWLDRLVPKDQDAKLLLVDLAWPSLDFAVNGDPVALSEASPQATPNSLAAALGTETPGPAGALARALTEFAALRETDADTRLEAALFRHFPALIERLSAQLDVASVTVADLPEPLVARYRAGDLLRVEVVPANDIAAPEARAAFVAAVAAVVPEAGGPPAQIEGAAQTVARAMVEAGLIALALCAALAWLSLRRLALVAAILVPVALAGAVTMAATVLLDMPFNYANVIVLPLLIGIGVDSGIHLALRTERASDVFATSTPRAVFWSALTTIGAFATLALSEHRGTASMGAMLAIALTAAVVMTFALTPALVRLGTRRPRL
ncbi:MAG: MMPL family transporter [Pseudomonadota bacterium]